MANRRRAAMPVGPNGKIDRKLLSTAEFVLAVKADIPDEAVRRQAVSAPGSWSRCGVWPWFSTPREADGRRP